jgi:hypothetical protein
VAIILRRFSSQNSWTFIVVWHYASASELERNLLWNRLRRGFTAKAFSAYWNTTITWLSIRKLILVNNLFALSVIRVNVSKTICTTNEYLFNYICFVAVYVRLCLCSVSCWCAFCIEIGKIIWKFAESVRFGVNFHRQFTRWIRSVMIWSQNEIETAKIYSCMYGMHHNDNIYITANNYLLLHV